MSVAVNIISAVVKSVVGEKVGNELAKDVIGISLDGISEKSIEKIDGFIRNGRAKIEHILSKENLELMNIPKDDIAFVVSEIKDLFRNIEITDEVVRQCKYDSVNLRGFLWNEYCGYKDGSYIECERQIKKGLCIVARTLIDLMFESEEFEKEMLVKVNVSIDKANVEIEKISKYLEENFCKLDVSNQMVLNILRQILGQTKNFSIQNWDDRNIEFQNNKKQDYVKNWNSRLFLHQNNSERSITLADAFIMPDYKMHKHVYYMDFSLCDTLDKIIEKFVEYEKTSTMLITGVPGIGKSTITSWIANKYKEDNKFVVLRFRDWQRKELEEGLLNAICNKTRCENEDLENKIFILDGYDEMKSLDMREKLLNDFVNGIKDFKNFKCIITSRPAYIDISYFMNVFELIEFDIEKIEIFYKHIKGSTLEKKEKIEPNLEILGIPVILYMAIMSNVDISENPTKPELYNRIFAEEGGIFDRFYKEGVDYGSGEQVLRSPKNIKKYLRFLREVAFKMFQKDNLSLLKKEYKIPELEFHGNFISVLEFPIRHLFENIDFNIEFIHKSIYEYFVSDYIFISLYKGTDAFQKNLAGDLGELFNCNILSPEILEFLKYKIRNSKIKEEFDTVNETFQLMLKDGMTYYTNKCYKNIIKREMNVFVNMLEIIHIFEKDSYNFDVSIFDYLKYNKMDGLNLSRTNLEKTDLSNIYLTRSDLKGAILRGADLRGTDLRGANLKGADLRGALVEEIRGTDLRETNLRRTLIGTLEEKKLENPDLYKANLEGAIFDERQVNFLKNKYNLNTIKIFCNEIDDIISYDEYRKRKGF